MSPELLLVIVILLAAARAYLYIKYPDPKKDKTKEKGKDRPKGKRKGPEESEDKLKGVKDTLDSLVWAGATALILITFVIRTFYIPSSSMVPTLRINDFILVNKFVYSFCNPARGDIVVFHPPKSANTEKTEYIKRIVAVGGDTVEVRGGTLFVNDQPQKEDYILEPMFYEMDKIKVPEDSYFAMGDNRNNSDDSHVWGFLPRKNLVGKAVLIFFPINRARTM